MKIHFDIDCTPDEARAFLGLPNVAPIQDAMMKQIEQRMQEALAATSPEALLNTWLPAGLAHLEGLQKMFWSQFGGGSGAGNGKKEK